MLSGMFMADYRKMAARGVALSPADVVRLNALALKVRLSSLAAHDVHMPRVAFLPRDSRWREPIALREPTMAHELWLEEASRWLDVDRTANWLFLHAYALSRPASALPDAFSPKAVVRAVFRFASRRLVRFTGRQLSAAVDYALYGSDWTAGENPPSRAAGEPQSGGPQFTAATAPSADSPAIGLLVEGRALRLPISLDDALRMTGSELEEAIWRARAKDGDGSCEASRRRALGDYIRARDEIASRAESRGAGASSPAERSPDV